MCYEDLLLVPYKLDGRDENGMDCYGMALECFRRDGKVLKDLRAVCDGSLEEYVKSVNVIFIDGPVKGCGIQTELNGRLHIGYLISKREVLHMTEEGARINDVRVFKNARFFEVVE